MANMRERIAEGKGFIAALDQSGGSTPGALKLYGITEQDYKNEEEMFAQVHAMRVRIITAPAFTGEKVLGAIVFEKTMDEEALGLSVPRFLWEQRQIATFLKVDTGLAEEKDGVCVMKPNPGLHALLDRAVVRGIFGTKMRSVIHQASASGIAAVVAQQFETAREILKFGLVPIVEPEVSIKSHDKAQSEKLLRQELIAALDALPSGEKVLLKLTLPEEMNFYAPLVDHPNVLRVLALSGGYTRADACRRLSQNRGLIASFSRALTQDLRHAMSDEAFNLALQQSVDEIYAASTFKGDI